MNKRSYYRISTGLLLFVVANMIIRHFVSLHEFINFLLFLLTPLSLIAAIVFALIGLFTRSSSNSTNFNQNTPGESKIIPIGVIGVSATILLMMAIVLMAIFAWKNS